MSFLLSVSELKKIQEKRKKGEGTTYYNAEILSFLWETRPDIYKKLLPYPLKPIDKPIVAGFVADYPRVSSLMPYKESGLFLVCKYKSTIGIYCLSMSLTDDIATIAGREFLGFPKKMAKIHFKRTGNIVEGWAERHGSRFFNVSAELNGKPNEIDALDIIKEYNLDSKISTCFNFKEMFSPDAKKFDYRPHLVACEVEYNTEEDLVGEVTLDLLPHKYDPWYEVEIVRLLGARYSRGTNILKSGKNLKRIRLTRLLSYVPHVFKKFDIITKEK